MNDDAAKIVEAVRLSGLTVDRVTALGAKQEQLQGEVEAVRAAVKSVQLLLVYVIVLAVILYLLISKKGVAR